MMVATETTVKTVKKDKAKKARDMRWGNPARSEVRRVTRDMGARPVAHTYCVSLILFCF